MIASGEVGEITVEADAIVSVTGLSSSATVGSVLVYDNIVPNPGTSWTPVSPSGGETWTEEEPTPGTNWTEIAA